MRNQLDERDKELGELRVKYEHNKEKERRAKGEVTEVSREREGREEREREITLISRPIT